MLGCYLDHPSQGTLNDLAYPPHIHLLRLQSHRFQDRQLNKLLPNNPSMENTDWKAIGIMAGVSAGVFLIGTLIERMVIDPMIEKGKAAKQKKAQDKQQATAG